MNLAFRLLGGEVTNASKDESAARNGWPEDREVYDPLLPFEPGSLVERIIDSYF